MTESFSTLIHRFPLIQIVIFFVSNVPEMSIFVKFRVEMIIFEHHHCRRRLWKFNEMMTK